MSKYRIDIAWSEEDQAYLARVPELDGVVTHGDSPAEAVAHAEEAIELHLESLEKHGEKIPDPVTLQNLSGNYPLRMGPDLHQRAVIAAAKNNQSLNEYLKNAIDETVSVSLGRTAFESPSSPIVEKLCRDIAARLEKKAATIMRAVARPIPKKVARSTRKRSAG